MQFSPDVFPAPFGPMSASSSPGRASKDTPFRTVSPPKASDKLSTRSVAPSAIPAAAPSVLLDFAVAPPACAAARAQVELAHVRVAAQPLGSAVEHDAAVLHEVAVVGDFERDIPVLL